MVDVRLKALSLTLDVNGLAYDMSRAAESANRTFLFPASGILKRDVSIA
jgi:hypothetical protein